MIKLTQDLWQLSKISCEFRLVQAGEPTRHEDLPNLDIVQHGPERIEAPLLRGLDQDRIAVKASDEFLVACHLALHTRDKIAADGEFVDPHTVVIIRCTVGLLAGGNPDVMTRRRHSLSDLTDHFLHATAARPIALAAKENLHVRNLMAP